MKSDTVCKHLRNKAMFIPALAQEQVTDQIHQVDSSSHCWCNCTLTETGPDDQPVGPQRCTSSRSCFKS